MKLRIKILYISFAIILIQIIYFNEYLSPFYWGQIKVSGLACTCPDASVINGSWYLKFITPDSLKKYKINYSEIFLTTQPSTGSDPMGTDYYIVKGYVIGKERVSEYDPWNLKLKVTEWKEVNILKDWGLKFLLGVELLIILVLTSNTVINKFTK